MLKAAKKNRVLQIPDEKRSEYENMGYTIRDEKGNVVFEPENKDSENEALKERVKELEKENADLKTELAKQGRKPEEQNSGEAAEKKEPKARATTKKPAVAEKEAE